MKKKVTIHDLAKMLNIDSSTVSRALANSPRVKQKTRDLIQAKAKELGYSRNVVASNLRSKRTLTIGVVVPYISRYFFSTVIAGIEEHATENGYQVIICQSHDQIEREQQMIQTLLSYQVDGLLVSISMETENTDHLKHVLNQEVPLVLFDRKCNGLSLPTIHIDDFQMGYEATKHLIDQGCRRIVHFTGSDQISIYHDRKQGYCQALKDHGLVVSEELILTSALKEADGKLLAQQVLDMPLRPDGIFCANDLTAISAMQLLIEKGVKIPEDIAFVGFSNEPLGNYLSPALTSVNQNPKEIGKVAMQTLLGELSTKPSPDTDRLVPAHLVVRASSLKKG
ncbi:LacI family transcriptional regulator [Reichenbachiella carrageenanivorans]|uniref:LacI family transcriptional regulator n=1 Tax=Reichenbachiella carrageenanivorans TaxID=2979869 RepID=A0ABY6D587_9BACT|nr:LacI family DNA-binding transcriptional regulator [Reichenbachiella carrageenanivorans]UXX81307.1 LacI family transcriptional regulator [Reichenbachiella carrageenanivorans]